MTAILQRACRCGHLEHDTDMNGECYTSGCKCRKFSSAPATATLQRVSPNPKRALSPEDETRIRFAMHVRDAANEHVRRTVLEAVAHGASVRVLAEFTGMSTNTISRWKADAKDPVERAE